MGGVSPRYVTPTTIRTGCNDHENTLLGWPLRGGLIVLGHVTGLDFSFLGLNSANPPRRRDEDQDAEDLFCQQLLWLVAAWFDSLSRWGFVMKSCDDDKDSFEKIEEEDEPDLTLMDRRWVSVGGPREGGGCWVAEYDTYVRFLLEPRNQPPPNAACVHLARTMDKKYEMLKGMGAKHSQSIKEYKGVACLNAWEKKTSGEFGPLVKY
ncbi:hypothetical protein BJ166DRAFT_543233 [Pestalotiopsis sp. NC0098]|nr:hypothetical protein BJ166DRAFT_543233 [Pestalotiopsis sp. NC0098]